MCRVTSQCRHLISSITSSTQNNVGQELGTVINMGALAVSQLLENSQEKGVELVLETSSFENQVIDSA